MKPLPFDEDYLGQHATAKVFQRAVEYYEWELVEEVVRRGDTLEALVQGSAEEPYHVLVRLDPASEGEPVAEVACTCPYEFEGWCKHVVAVLLRAIEMPRSIPERPPLAETLAGLDREALAAVLLDLAARRPGLAAEIEEAASERTRKRRRRA